MNTTIDELIPHRSPFLFVDSILVANEDEVIGVKTFSKTKDKLLTGSLVGRNLIPGVILVESMAQCGGAGLKLADLSEGLFGLASIDGVKFLKPARYDEEIKYVIKNIKVSRRIIKQSGIAYSNDIPLMEATWICARIDN